MDSSGSSENVESRVHELNIKEEEMNIGEIKKEEELSVEQIFAKKEVPSWKKQLTIRAFVVSFVLSVMFSFIVMKLNLTVGIIPSLNVSAGLLGFFFVKTWTKLLERSGLLKQPFTRQENIVIHTCVVVASGIAFSATYVGVGMICPHIVNVSVLIGGILSWGIMWPLIETRKGHWYSADLDPDSMQGRKGYKRRTQLFVKDQIPTWLAIGGYVAISAVSTATLPHIFHQLKWYHIIVIYIFAPVLAFCNAFGCGLTDWSLASAYGKLAIFTIGAWAGASHGGVLAGLAACGVMMNIVSTASDLMQDFKIGYMTLASPRSMFVSQVIGTV
ncbi:putative metal-nicotianamine transporter YSL7 [Abeliophyllum distichum]|uniref:Metal-nicotianamine transporter YSL7 n=1 Tax=Abeliophyllum distichum TaxID=126358 RepID=A0ABD1V6S3_9LAMI